MFVLFLLVQVAALGNVIPLETAPACSSPQRGAAPDRLRQRREPAGLGGHVGSFIAVVVLLLVWAVIGYALLVSAVKKRRMLDPPQPGRVALSPV